MADWSKNHAAHTYTYLTRRVLDMTETRFEQAATLKM